MLNALLFQLREAGEDLSPERRERLEELLIQLKDVFTEPAYDLVAEVKKAREQ